MKLLNPLLYQSREDLVTISNGLRDINSIMAQKVGFHGTVLSLLLRRFALLLTKETMRRVCLSGILGIRTTEATWDS